MKLTDTHLVLLSAASQREDNCLELLPDVDPAAAEKLVATMAGAGLIEEIQAIGSMPVWRRVDEVAFALRITAKGLTAIGVGDGPVVGGADAGGAEAPSVVAPAAKTRKAGAWQKPSKAKAAPKPSKSKNGSQGGKKLVPRASAMTRGGSKIDQVRGLLMRKRGATIQEMMELTTWLPHTTRAVLAGLRKRGFDVRREASKDKPTVYRIASAEAASAKTHSQAA